MSSFFTAPSTQKKRKRPETSEAPKKRFAASKPAREKTAPRTPKRDESISGSDAESDAGLDVTFEGNDDVGGSSGSDGEGETAAEKRLRLAERYLENVREEVDEVGFDAEDIDRDLIAERLQEDTASTKGRMYRKLAGELSFDAASHTFFNCNLQSFTSVATCPPYAYTVSKDICLVKWKIQDLPNDQIPPTKKNNKMPPPPKRKPEQVGFVRGDKKKVKDTSFRGHVDVILCVVASEDGKFVCTGGRDRRLIIWDAETLKPLRVYDKHRDAVTGLAFRRGTNQLYSSSKDRTIKIWSLDELAYVETLFGHQDEVVDVAALAQERCVSVGARDRTARYWKVVEETQLVFRGGGGSRKSSSGPKVMEGSMDRVAMIDEEMFVTGGDNGSLSLWVIHKKKPIFTLHLAHGMDPTMAADEASAERFPDVSIVPASQPRWITALATIPYSDMILSGSWDGQIRAWRVSEDKKKIEAMGIVGSVPILNGDAGVSTPVHELSARGVVNDISVFERGDKGKDGVCIIAACGKEHRFGRWNKIKNGKNGAVVFEVPKLATKTNGAAKDSTDE